MSGAPQAKNDSPTIAITAIWVRRSGDHVIVSVEIDGVWREAIREFLEGPFSHIAEARGADRWELDATEFSLRGRRTRIT